ncbi:MAG TPA: AAA family ATPase [Candidatus Limnocylindrales bacterium]|nr:AAA family ATPase [Candidatus Limnocylindrales bacterium]
MAEQPAPGPEARALLFGRERELASLRAALAAAARGRGRLVLVTGEPGIGKSRLVDALADEAAATATILWGRSWEAGGAPAYWPWVQAMRGLVSAAGGDATRLERLATEAGAAVAQLLPELARYASGAPQPPSGDEEGARFHLFDAAARLLRAAATERPLLLVLEDVHAADVPTVLLLDFVSRSLDDARILLVTTYRDEELPRGDPRRTVISALARSSGAERIALAGLSNEDIAAQARAIAGTMPSPAVLSSVARESEGNPLFAAELIRLIASEGGLDAPDAPARLAVPDTIRDLIERRLALLTPGAQALLETAAVVGRDVDPGLVARLAGVSEVDVLEQLAEASRERILADAAAQPGRVRFTHGLVREVLYERLGAARRARLHLKVAELLEAADAGDVGARQAEVAHHYLAALPEGPPGRAAEHAGRAAAAALAQLAYEEAARLYGLGASAAQRAGDVHLRCDLLLGLGEAQARAGDARARPTFLEAAELARREGFAEHLARAALGYGGRFVWEASRGDPHLVDLLRAALDALPGGDSPLRVRLMARLAAGPLRDDPERATRDALSREAVEMARRLGDPATMAYALDGRYAAAWWPENAEERVGTATELIEAATAAGDRERALQGHHYRCLVRLELADIDGARADSQAQSRIAEQLRQPAQLLYVRTVEAMLAVLEGRFDEAERFIAEAHGLGRRAEQSMADIYRAMLLAGVGRHRGAAAEVVAELERLAAALPSYVVLRCALADLRRRAGEGGTARRELVALAADGFASVPRNDEWVFATCLLGEVAAELGSEATAADLLGLLEPYAGRVAVSAPDGCLGSVARTLAILAARLGRDEQAAAWFERALSIEEAIGARPWLAETQATYATFLAQQGGEAASSQRTRHLRVAALRTARELGMERLEARLAADAKAHGVETARVARCFMFTDVVRSTELVSAIGDEAWLELRAWHDRALQEIIDAHHGRVISHTGDGFFVAFEDAAAAVACAAAIQRALRDHRREAGFAPQVRIGLHAGEAIEETDAGYSGQAVHQAARIAALAGGGEIVASVASLGGLDLPTRDRRVARLKGIADPVEVAAIEWQAGGGSAGAATQPGRGDA